jgi:hypothetical protein
LDDGEFFAAGDGANAARLLTALQDHPLTLPVTALSNGSY